MNVKMIFLSLFCSIPLFAGTDLAVERFLLANKQYEAGRYDSAIVLYQKVLDADGRDARVYYNMGNAHFRKKELAKSILSYERALWLSPDDGDVKASLEFARSQTVDKIVPTEPSFFFKGVFFLHQLLPFRVQTVMIPLLLFVMAGLFTLFFLSSNGFRSLASSGMIVCAALLILIVPSFLVKRHDRATRETAVVMSHQVNAVNEPHGSEILFAVHEGARFTLQRKVDDFAFGSLDNGLAGWVDTASLGLVEVR